MTYAEMDSGCIVPNAPSDPDSPRHLAILERAASWYEVPVIYPDDAFAQRVHEFLVTMRIAEARCAIPMTHVTGDVDNPDAPLMARRYVL